MDTAHLNLVTENLVPLPAQVSIFDKYVPLRHWLHCHYIIKYYMNAIDRKYFLPNYAAEDDEEQLKLDIWKTPRSLNQPVEAWPRLLDFLRSDLPNHFRATISVLNFTYILVKV